MSIFQERLRKTMFFKGIRQVDIIERTGIDKSKISRYVSGQNMPSGDTLAKLANALGVSAAWLAGEGPDMDPVELTRDDFQTIPVVGRVAAGAPIFAVENQVDTIAVKDTRTGLFGLRIVGDSMAPRIMDGDLVVVQQQDNAKDGDIVIAIVDDEATCKVYKKSPWGVSLVPFNSSYAPFIFAGEETDRLHIVGKVVGSYHSWE